jgi:colicin import membrane protein
MRKSAALKQEQRRFAFWLCVASALHAAVIALTVMAQLYYVRSRPPMKVVSVTLLSLPGPPGSSKSPVLEAPKEPAGETENTESAKPEPEARQVAPEPVRTTKKVAEPVPQKEASRPVKKVAEEPDRSKREHLAETLEQLRKKTALQKPSSSPSGGLKDVLARLQKKIGSQGSRQVSSGGWGSGIGGNPYGSGGQGAFDPYKAKIAGIIQQNWSFSRQMLRSTAGMEVYVAVNILPNGTIREVVYERKAPSEYLNNSVKIALDKSDPLPPIPGEYGSRDIWVGFVFTPEGIEQQ